MSRAVLVTEKENRLINGIIDDIRIKRLVHGGPRSFSLRANKKVSFAPSVYELLQSHGIDKQLGIVESPWKHVYIYSFHPNGKYKNNLSSLLWAISTDRIGGNLNGNAIIMVK